MGDGDGDLSVCVVAFVYILGPTDLSDLNNKEKTRNIAAEVENYFRTLYVNFVTPEQKVPHWSLPWLAIIKHALILHTN